jgi:hypothetical protein
VRRHSIRFTLRGWQYRDEEGNDWLIEFNWPWRRSWPIRIRQDHVVLQSRSGETHLARKLYECKQRNDRSKTARAKVLPILVLPLITAVFLLWPTESEPQPATSSQPLNQSCKHLFANIEPAIDAWLANASTGRLSFTGLEQFELGGVRQLIVLAACDTQKQQFRVQVTKNGEVWRLSKTSRLAD